MLHEYWSYITSSVRSHFTTENGWKREKNVVIVLLGSKHIYLWQTYIWQSASAVPAASVLPAQGLVVVQPDPDAQTQISDTL